MFIKFPLAPFATFLLHLQLLLQGSFHQEEVKQPHCRDTQRPKIMNFWGLLRHQITCHSPPFPVCQNSASTVARTYLTKTACLKIWWWSMELAVSKKYCKTDICLSCRHTEGSATLSSRRGSALRSSSAGNWTCRCWGQFCEGNQVVAGWNQCGGTKHKRERRVTPVMSVTKLSSLCKCLASTQFVSTVAMCFPARVVARC